VRYAEYENEEDVNLGMLESLPETSIDEEEGSSEGELGDESEDANLSLADQSSDQIRRGFNTIPLLPPPMPPHLLRHQGHLPEEDEAMASMLMSWYTSGYHTGYYQAMRDMKKMKK